MEEYNIPQEGDTTAPMVPVLGELEINALLSAIESNLGPNDVMPTNPTANHTHDVGDDGLGLLKDPLETDWNLIEFIDNGDTCNGMQDDEQQLSSYISDVFENDQDYRAPTNGNDAVQPYCAPGLMAPEFATVGRLRQMASFEPAITYDHGLRPEIPNGVLPYCLEQRAINDWVPIDPGDTTGAGYPSFKPPQQPLIETWTPPAWSKPAEMLEGLLNAEPYTCIECRFSHETCDGLLGVPCRRCINLDKKATNKAAQIRNGVTSRRRIPRAIQSSGSVLHVIFFDVGKTHTLLIQLRAEIDARVTGISEDTLESRFRRCNQYVCHIDDAEHYNPYSVTGVPIAITQLSTTISAKRNPNPETGLVDPALRPETLDRFIDSRVPLAKFESLSQYDKNLLTAAWRCVNYLAILFNWNRNMIYHDDHAAGRLNMIPAAKNLVLETMYAIVYRIQSLVKIILHEVSKSLSGDSQTCYGDPATISCALWILYRPINRFKKLKWDAKNLLNLEEFLNGLHGRTAGALTAIQHYRWKAALKCCGKKSGLLENMVQLVDNMTEAKAMVSLTYEAHIEHLRLLPNKPEFLQPKSYTDVLEAVDFLYIWEEERIIVPTASARPMTGPDTDTRVAALTAENLSAMNSWAQTPPGAQSYRGTESNISWQTAQSRLIPTGQKRRQSSNSNRSSSGHKKKKGKPNHAASSVTDGSKAAKRQVAPPTTAFPSINSPSSSKSVLSVQLEERPWSDYLSTLGNRLLGVFS